MEKNVYAYDFTIHILLCVNVLHRVHIEITPREGMNMRKAIQFNIQYKIKMR